MLSRWYDRIYRFIKWFRVPVHWAFGTHPELAQLVDSGRIRPGRAVDLGCGAGREVVYLASQGFEVTGVDISPTAIAMAREAADAAGVDVELVVDDLTRLSGVIGRFDLIVDYGALNDLTAPQRDAYMSRVPGLAADGSQFVLMCFDRKLPLDEIHDRFGGSYEIECISTKSEAASRRSISVYLMERRTQLQD